MAIKFETVQAGDVLYDVHSERMGNTTMRRMGCWTVHVISIDHVAGKAMIRWNGNPAKVAFRHEIERYRRSPPKEKRPTSPA